MRDLSIGTIQSDLAQDFQLAASQPALGESPRRLFPEPFFDWLEVRKQSPEFREKFPHSEEEE